MANDETMTDAHMDAVQPAVRKIGIGDLADALSKGLADFKERPSHVVFLCITYPVVGLLLVRLSFGYDILPLIFPLVAGYALIGPIAAIGLYELSRRREQGLEVTWAHAFSVVRSPSIGAIVRLSMGLMGIFVAWLIAAQIIYQSIFGSEMPVSVAEFVNQIFNTPSGWNMIMVGNGVGFVFAVISLTFGVVSFPLLLDRNVGATIAVNTSIKAVLANPFTMAVWGFIVALALVIGAIPFFFGLAVVLPVLGHASWHLYRKVVV